MVDAGNRERGLKAALHNPRVSEQAKQRDREILETEFGEHFEEGGTTTISEPEMATSPEGAASVCLGELSDDYSYPESPPVRVKQTAVSSSSSKPDASSSAKKSRTTAKTSSRVMSSSSEMMEGGGGSTTSRRAPVSSSSSSPMKTRSASAGDAASSAGRSSKRESGIQGIKDTGNVYVCMAWLS